MTRRRPARRLGPGDLDVDLDGALDPQLPLTDAYGNTRGPLLLSQNDARFLAHWGVDTYMRDWKILVDIARAYVGPSGLVLVGGHSQGTTWAGTFAAYDFDPGPGVDAAYTHIDGLLLLEGGGVGTGSANVNLSTGAVPRPTDTAGYLAIVSQLETPGGPDVFLSNFSGIDLLGLGTTGEVASLAAHYLPNDASIAQRTPVFGSGLAALLLSAPASNRTVIGLFLDDDFSPISAFRASIGFSDNGPNTFLNLQGFSPFYLAGPATSGPLRTWRDFDDPTLPTCPPNVFNVSPGCAILDNGPPGGLEREVTALGDFAQTQFGKLNGFEWYFVSGRVTLDFAYGRNSSAVGDESLLAVTQNANVDVPVLAIGGSNGLTPTTASFASYFGSIATPAPDKQAVIIGGYAHLDVTTARNNDAVPIIAGWINGLLP